MSKASKPKCIECKASSKYLWVLNKREADFGVQIGTIRWTTYQCRKCHRVFIVRENIPDEQIKQEEAAEKQG